MEWTAVQLYDKFTRTIVWRLSNIPSNICKGIMLAHLITEWIIDPDGHYEIQGITTTNKSVAIIYYSQIGITIWDQQVLPEHAKNIFPPRDRFGFWFNDAYEEDNYEASYTLVEGSKEDIQDILRGLISYCQASNIDYHELLLGSVIDDEGRQYTIEQSK